MPIPLPLRWQWMLGLLIACGGAALWPFVMIGLLGLMALLIGSVALLAVQIRIGLLAATARPVWLLLGAASVVTVVLAMFLSPFTFITDAGRLGPFHPTIRLSVIFGTGVGQRSIAMPLFWIGGAALVGFASSGMRWPLRASVPGMVVCAFLAGPLAAVGFWVISRVWPLGA
jgi:hypothetical protein